VNGLVLGRFDAAGLTKLFDQEGVLSAVERKGFRDPRVTVVDVDSTPPHIRLEAEKAGRRHLLLDARLTEVSLAPERPPRFECSLARPVSLAVIFWACEQDPTQTFSQVRPRLPLQDHPGLGLLGRVFRVAAQAAVESGKDGLANMPKFPHDAAIFFRSLRFLFLDPAEQGRFDALCNDLGALGLRDLSLAVVGGAVKEADGVVSWRPGLQVHPLTPVLSDYFASEAYASARSRARAATRYTVDAELLHAAAETFKARAGA
jgi:hypothetical protein